MMTEQWKVIDAFPDYAISSYGRIKRIIPDWRGRSGNILKSTVYKDHCNVTLYKNKQPFQVAVHRAVCIAFHGEPPTDKHHAAHNNGKGTDNRKDNLRWATPKENEADKILHGKSRLGKPSAVPVENRPRGEKHGRYTMPERSARGERIWTSKLTAEKVIAIRGDCRARRQVAADYGITVTMVGYIQRGISWAHIPMEQK